MLYRKKPSADFLLDLQPVKDTTDAVADMNEEKTKVSCNDKVKKTFNEVIKIYGPASLRKKALICHFTWCVTSLTYYMLALNAANFKANIYVWTGLTGTVDIFGYIVSIFILKWSTRRMSQFTLFVLAGAFLLIILGISKEREYVLLGFAMASRFCITSVYAILTLHTAEMFPTEIRNSVLGISSTAAHFGSFFAPYIGEFDIPLGFGTLLGIAAKTHVTYCIAVDLLGPLAWYIPTTICGTLVSSWLAMILSKSIGNFLWKASEYGMVSVNLYEIPRSWKFFSETIPYSDAFLEIFPMIFKRIA